ncbi:hypothetical protein CASFOL_015192 [Castilleja foliolosa]|uniref:Uncharacterized protein n=1 Tax=Castilleja foliolosa TaxID=1961234 RepID=A0ABD3DGM4_9LAMI
MAMDPILLVVVSDMRLIPVNSGGKRRVDDGGMNEWPWLLEGGESGGLVGRREEEDGGGVAAMGLGDAVAAGALLAFLLSAGACS